MNASDPIASLAERLGRPGTGISAWSLYGTSATRVSIGVKDGCGGTPHVPPSSAESATARYLIVWDDGLVSRGGFERRQLDEPDAAIAHARIAAYDDPDAAQVLGPQEVPDVTLWDDGVAAIASGDATLLADRLGAITARVADGPVGTWSASLSASAAHARLVSSAGLDLRGRGTSVGWHVSVNGAIGDGFGARTADSDAEFTARLDRLLDVARALEVDVPAPAASTRPVLLHPNVVESYVLSTLLENLGGSGVAHGESHFDRSSFGAPDPVLREDFTFRLDPLVPLRSGSYRFTSEGVPAARIAYIECGRLVTPVVDLKYARRLGIAPTPLPYDADSLRFEGLPALEQSEAFDSTDDGVLVLSVLGVHTQDSTSGDFSLSTPHALRLDRGRPSGHVRGTISGNLFEALDDPATRLVRWPGETTPGLLLRVRFDPA